VAISPGRAPTEESLGGARVGGPLLCGWWHGMIRVAVGFNNVPVGVVVSFADMASGSASGQEQESSNVISTVAPSGNSPTTSHDEAPGAVDHEQQLQCAEAGRWGQSKDKRGAGENDGGPAASRWGVVPQGRGRWPSDVVTSRCRATPDVRAWHTLRPAFGTSGMFRGQARRLAVPPPRRTAR
jgi:hypothetical protein